MNKNKHISLSERAMIEQHLNNRMSFRGIGRELSKDPTTIAKEVKNHIYFKSSGAYGRPFPYWEKACKNSQRRFTVLYCRFGIHQPYNARRKGIGTKSTIPASEWFRTGIYSQSADSIQNHHIDGVTG